jgi:hypothetical protein
MTTIQTNGEEEPLDGKKTATHRFTLTISGGLAMGAYEAGVLSQFYADIWAINEANIGCRLIIDSISGASAGSITGLVVAQALALKLTPAEFDNNIRQTWIAGPDIIEMLKPIDSKDQGVFTHDRLEHIASQVIEPVQGDDTFERPGEAIAIWMAITNLEGIPYEMNFNGGSNPTTVFGYNYHDYTPYHICGKSIRNVVARTEDLPLSGQSPPFNWQSATTSATWNEAASNAIASGSFPIAFRTKPLFRNLDLYGNYRNFKQPGWPDTLTFQVADGGILGNEPLGKAIDAVSYLNWVDPERQDDPRSYLIIDPHPNSATDVKDALESVQSEVALDGLPFLTALGRLISVYFNTALYSDYMNTIQVNEQLAAIDGIYPQPCPEKAAVLAAFGLNFKRSVVLERIPRAIPTKNRLAGDFFGDFGGFLQEDFREFDYSVGRVEARQWFKKWLQFSASNLNIDSNAVIAALGMDPVQATPDLNGADWFSSVTRPRRLLIVNTAFNRIRQLVLGWTSLKTIGKYIASGIAGLLFLIFLKKRLITRS